MNRHARKVALTASCTPATEYTIHVLGAEGVRVEQAAILWAAPGSYNEQKLRPEADQEVPAHRQLRRVHRGRSVGW